MIPLYDTNALFRTCLLHELRNLEILLCFPEESKHSSPLEEVIIFWLRMNPKAVSSIKAVVLSKAATIPTDTIDAKKAKINLRGKKSEICR